MGVELVHAGWMSRAAGLFVLVGVLLPGCSNEEKPAAEAPPAENVVKPAEGAAGTQGGGGAPGAAAPATGERTATMDAAPVGSAAAPEVKAPEAAEPAAPPPPPAADVCAVPKKLEKTRSGLQYALLTEGQGPLVKKGQQITVHYTGWLKDCSSKFDSSRGGRPFSFKVGEGLVIDGWEEAALLLHVGDKATLVIPPKLGYGAEGSPPEIPGNATLVFNIEVLGAR